MNAGRHLCPACSVPGTLHLLYLLLGCFPRQSQGSRVSTSKAAAALIVPSEHRSQLNSAFSMLVQCVLYTAQSIVSCPDLWVDPQHLGQCLDPQQTSADWMNGGGACLSVLYRLHHGMCPLLTEGSYRIIWGIIGLTQPLYWNNCYTIDCWLSHFYSMNWKSLKTWKIVYFSSDLDKSIIEEKFKAINWSLHCNYL